MITQSPVTAINKPIGTKYYVNVTLSQFTTTVVLVDGLGSGVTIEDEGTTDREDKLKDEIVIWV
jgi:hypothetical protein